ncbi:MAG: hypothetical protein R3E50_03905 [Halioglobus sp.]
MTNDLSLFHADPLALLMMVLVGFIGLAVAAFAYRYMKGDAHYRRFFVLLALLVLSVMVMVAADQLALLLAAWGLSNALLVTLMVHKGSWQAARASGWLAGRTYLFGFAAIAAAFGLLYAATGQGSIQAILRQDSGSPLITPACRCCCRWVP